MLVYFQYGMQFYWYLCENMKLSSNKVDNFEALYCTMALITVEMGCRDIMADLLRLALDLQVGGVQGWRNLTNVYLSTDKWF